MNSESPNNIDQHQQTARIVIVGGGVIGAACAYYLNQSGADVTVIDRGAFGQGCSHGNCGYLSPSHILPLCQPGAVTSTLKTMFQKNSAFSIKPRFDLSLFNWLLQFARKCNHKDMLHAGYARQALLDSSRELYLSLFQANILDDCELHTDGLLFVHDQEEHFHHYEKTDKLLQDEFGLAAKPFAGAELTELEPALKAGIAGGWLYECDSHVRPDKVMAAWKRRLEENQVEIIEDCQFQSIESSNGTVNGIQTSTGPIKTDQVIFATGALTPTLGKQLQASIPIQPGKGYSLTMPRPKVCPKYPMIFEEHRVAITPMDSGYRIGSTMEFAGYDSTIREERLELLVNGAKHYLKEPMAEPIQEKWSGWRPMSSDGIPMIGQLPKFKNAWIASGHSMLGLSMATATGKLVAELITQQTPHVDPTPYRVDRF
ncbi:FAD-dependent oxidoreductase [bacterium]|nr:FAD-dependent oxidoreductase [bacterium]